MRKILASLAAAAFAVTALVAAPGNAEARRYRHHGGEIAAGVAAAVIGGIIISQMHRRHHRRYYYDDYYDGYDYGYYRPRYYSNYGYAPRRYYGGGWGGRSWAKHRGHHGGGLRVHGGHRIHRRH